MALIVTATSKSGTYRLAVCPTDEATFAQTRFGEWCVQGFSAAHNVWVTLHECGGLEANGKSFFKLYKGK